MKFSEYCNMVEGSEQEQQLLTFLKQDKMQGIIQDSVKAKRVPIIGKVVTAVEVLAGSESIFAFKNSAHYKYLMNWELNFDPAKDKFYLTLSEVQKEKIRDVLSFSFSVISFLLLYRKIRRREKKQWKKEMKKRKIKYIPLKENSLYSL
ncbi:MAG: hypothetical protein FWC32_00305 [Firmicutes bacterium]|nr:hypothetical protein [Bacillota bacterium]